MSFSINEVLYELCVVTFRAKLVGVYIMHKFKRTKPQTLSKDHHKPSKTTFLVFVEIQNSSRRKKTGNFHIMRKYEGNRDFFGFTRPPGTYLSTEPLKPLLPNVQKFLFTLSDWPDPYNFGHILFRFSRTSFLRCISSDELCTFSQRCLASN
jgi:hypothetical protein